MFLMAAYGCSKNETPTTPTPPACTVTAGAISASTFGAAGGTGSVPVTAGTGCTWTATSSATFVTISAGASGSGNGTASFTVAANSGAARTATLTIAGTTFTISQSAATAPAPGSLSAPTAASPVGGQQITVNRPPLVVNNATATGTVGAVTYRFEISDQPTFPNDAVRTFSVDGVPQTPGTTTGVVPRDLGLDVLWYWHARATDGTVTSAYSPTETFRTGSACTFSVSPSTASVSSSGGTVTITVTTGSTCSWTATSNAAFITVTAGASGTGNGTVTATVAPGGSGQSGTLTVAGQTVTITQGSAGNGGIVAGFRMLDPATTAGPSVECRVTSNTGTVCTLESTSFPLGTNGLVGFAWTVQWTDGDVQTRTQSGASPTFSFTWTCGGPASTTDGAAQPLAVTLTVTDSLGSTATAAAGSGNQPPLFMRLFKC
jgi:all-beta uncharacterized protein